MAITLNTGTPGAGKTLYTLWTVENRRKQENEEAQKNWIAAGSPADNPPLIREVYYHNIKIKKLPWYKLENVQDWYKLPTGSIIVFDECQEAFPPRPTGSKVPEYVSELAKHRHKGYDIYFITQHPSFVDSYVRKLPEFHNHLMRPFGAKRAVVHSFKGVRDAVDKTRKDSIRSAFSYPKEVFHWYTSAETHTHKFSMPWKLWALIFVPIAIAACAYGAYYFFEKKINPAPLSPAKLTVKDSTGKSAPAQIQKATFDPANYKPRFADLPHTAPRYDEITTPTVAPQIVGCLILNKNCKCVTQQGTYHLASMDFCQSVIANGIFHDFGELAERKRDNKEPSRIAESSGRAVVIQAVPTPIPAPAAEQKQAKNEPYVPYTQRFSNTPSLSILQKENQARLK